MKIYYIYQDVHGTAANFENVMCAIISGKQGIEIDKQDCSKLEFFPWIFS